MMTREEVYQIIDREREYQDTTYNPNEADGSGVIRSIRDLGVTPHLVLLNAYVGKATDEWVKPHEALASLQQIAKVAAIAVRALERAGGSHELLTKGLR